MRIKPNLAAWLVSPILFALVVAISPTIASHDPGLTVAGTPALASAVSKISAEGAGRPVFRLADSHSDACLWNYNTCMKGCDGATSCSNQCKTNYDNCLKQAG